MLPLFERADKRNIAPYCRGTSRYILSRAKRHGSDKTGRALARFGRHRRSVRRPGATRISIPPSIRRTVSAYGRLISISFKRAAATPLAIFHDVGCAQALLNVNFAVASPAKRKISLSMPTRLFPGNYADITRTWSTTRRAGVTTTIAFFPPAREPAHRIKAIAVGRIDDDGVEATAISISSSHHRCDRPWPRRGIDTSHHADRRQDIRWGNIYCRFLDDACDTASAPAYLRDRAGETCSLERHADCRSVRGRRRAGTRKERR